MHESCELTPLCPPFRTSSDHANNTTGYTWRKKAQFAAAVYHSGSLVRFKHSLQPLRSFLIEACKTSKTLSPAEPLDQPRYIEAACVF